jgi:hypothetical protein
MRSPVGLHTGEALPETKSLWGYQVTLAEKRSERQLFDHLPDTFFEKLLLAAPNLKSRSFTALMKKFAFK